MTTRTLDRSRNFGTVVGASNGAAFYQDGLHFRGDGSCLEDDAIPAETPATIPEKPGPNEVKLGSAEAQRAQLEALHPSQIKKLVVAEGLELETGKGSKARNIKNLLAAG